MENKFLQEYNIPFVGMKHNLHKFEYFIDGTFFSNFEESSIDNCKIDVKLDFDKKESFFLLNFYIDGFVKLPCDRCSEDFDQEIFGDFEVAVKFGDGSEIENLDEDVVYIAKSDDFINVAKLIYDFIVLSIPLRCVHPNDKDGNSTCNKDVLAKLSKNENTEVDPRWAALEKLKNKK